MAESPLPPASPRDERKTVTYPCENCSHGATSHGPLGDCREHVESEIGQRVCDCPGWAAP